MEIGSFESVQDGEVAALTPIETIDFRDGNAWLSRNEFRPAVIAAIVNLQEAELVLGTKLVKHAEQLLEVLVHREGSGFIHKPSTRAERRDDNRVSVPVCVSCSHLNSC